MTRWQGEVLGSQQRCRCGMRNEKTHTTRGEQVIISAPWRVCAAAVRVSRTHNTQTWTPGSSRVRAANLGGCGRVRGGAATGGNRSAAAQCRRVAATRGHRGFAPDFRGCRARENRAPKKQKQKQKIGCNPHARRVHTAPYSRQSPARCRSSWTSWSFANNTTDDR